MFNTAKFNTVNVLYRNIDYRKKYVEYRNKKLHFFLQNFKKKIEDFLLNVRVKVCIRVRVSLRVHIIHDACAA